MSLGFLLLGSSSACLPFPTGDGDLMAERETVFTGCSSTRKVPRWEACTKKAVVWQTDVVSLF